jgi:hypothetical protein
MQPLAAHAESVTYLGEVFPVDSLTPVQPDQVTVSVGGSSFMVSEKNLGRRVALAYAEDAKLAKALPWSKYIGFVDKITDPGDRDLLKASARTFLSSQELAFEEREQLAGALKRVDPKGEALLGALQSAGSSSHGVPVCMAIRTFEDSARIAAKEKSQEILLRHNAVCSEFFRKSSRKHVSEGLVDEAVQDLDVAVSVFTLGAELDGSIVAARHRLTEMQSALASRDSFMYRNAFQEAAKDPFLAGVLKEGRTPIVQQGAATFLNEGLSGGALSILTLVDFERRSESTHELVSKALLELKPQDLEVLKQEKVRRVLIEFALKDDVIKEQLLSVLDSVIGEDVAKGDLSLAGALFDAVREIRPDPSPQNDRFRFVWAERLLNQGQITQAQSMVASASTSTPLLLHLNLLMKSDPFFAAVSGAALLGFAGLLVFRRRRAMVQTPHEEARERTVLQGSGVDGEEDEQPRKARFVRYSSDLRGGGIRDEYKDLLAVFGMQPGVKLSHIKNAYRNAVKSCHPDLHRNASSAEADKFIHLTQTYERLLQLHEERTGER